MRERLDQKESCMDINTDSEGAGISLKHSNLDRLSRVIPSTSQSSQCNVMSFLV